MAWLLPLAISAGSADSPPLPAAAAVKVDFARDIEPIFASRCYECHGEKKSKSGFRLDDKARAFQGGDSGKPFLIPGKSAQSQIILRVAGLVDEDEVMPRTGERLTTQQIGLLEAWIDQGASWPETVKKPHWAYVKPVRPALPKVEQSQWVRNPIDSFVLARLDKEKLVPSAEADAVTLIRRLSLDLIGLPPTRARMHTSIWWTACWLRRISERGGRAFGSTWRVTRTRTVTRRTRPGVYGLIAIGSSRLSIGTCRSINSPSNKSPATCCPAPRRTRELPAASIATP
jgi:mono/diheme cytochrome c family protein